MLIFGSNTRKYQKIYLQKINLFKLKKKGVSLSNF